MSGVAEVFGRLTTIYPWDVCCRVFVLEAMALNGYWKYHMKVVRRDDLASGRIECCALRFCNRYSS